MFEAWAAGVCKHVYLPKSSMILELQTPAAHGLRTKDEASWEHGLQALTRQDILYRIEDIGYRDAHIQIC